MNDAETIISTQRPAKMTDTIIELRVPASRLDCVSWISLQSPDIVADCLETCRAARNCLLQELGREEVAKLSSEIAALQAELIKSERTASTKLEKALAEALDAQKKQLSANFSETWSHQVKDLEDRCTRLVKELHDADQRHALRLAEDKELFRVQYSQQVESIRKETAHELVATKKAADQQAEAAKKYWQEVQKLNDEIKGLYQKHSQDLHQAQERHYNETKQMHAEREELAGQYKEFVSSFRGSATQIGIVGEELVAKVHEGMNLGTWYDTSHENSCGMADAQWKMDFPNCPQMSCLVEIKNSSRLHTAKDLKKFSDDVSEATRQQRANCALMISLTSRIQNTKGMLDLKFEHGVPILRASRSVDSPLPAQTLVEMALTTMVSMWPLIQKQRGQNSTDSVFESIAELFEAQLVEVTKLSKQIDDIDRTGRSLQRTAGQLRKSRDALATGVDGVRIQFPQLMPSKEDCTSETPTEDPWTLEEAQTLFDCIHSYKQSHHGRYPKVITDLTSLPEEIASFVNDWGLDMKTAVEKAKAQVPKGPKRARTAPPPEEEVEAE